MLTFKGFFTHNRYQDALEDARRDKRDRRSGKNIVYSFPSMKHPDIIGYVYYDVASGKIIKGSENHSDSNPS